MASSYSVSVLDRFPLVSTGDDLTAVILACSAANDHPLLDGDVVVLAQKVVSKAEGRLVRLSSVKPGANACELARQTGKDPRVVELILSESERVVRARPGVVIVRHRLGFVLANAGIDQSNIDHAGDQAALLLPLDPDGSAAQLRTSLERATGKRLGVLIIDSIGRAWRMGTIGTAIGVAGMPALQDLRGKPDLYGRKLESSELAFADEVAAAASLLMGQAGEGTPLAIVRGLAAGHGDDDSAAALVRPPALDLFL